MTKFIFVTGGVVSGLGKGITAASLGRLLKNRGYKVAAQKLDPYINVDPGTMSPYQHGEVFVTDDGAETDLDLGHYERFMDENLTKYSNLTSGKVYWNVLQKERNGDYLGQTVQVIPHVTNEIKDFIYKSAEASKAEILITEIGGTIGDIESQPFLEAIRQIPIDVGRDNCLFIHVTLVPYLAFAGEHKSKPSQHSVKELRSLGIAPDVIVARSDEPINESIKAKLALFCNVKPDCVIENITLPCLYAAPMMLSENGLDKVVLRGLKLENKRCDMKEWSDMVASVYASNETVSIAIVGKYVQLHDAYLSVMESLYHSGYAQSKKVTIKWVDCETLDDSNIAKELGDVSGILVPGGFGIRGIEGKISACKFARENNIPYLGICLGMQIAVIEYARNVVGLKNANSGEFVSENGELVIDLMPDQYGNIPMGGTMRLGSYDCCIKEGTMMHKAYNSTLISERHRHRYEFNNKFKKIMEDAGLVISGTSPDGRIVETVEVKENDFFVACQFHPEFKSRPNRPHPLFYKFVESSINYAKK